MKRPTLGRFGIGFCSLILIVACCCSASEGGDPGSDECIACHGRRDLVSRHARSVFIDPKRFAASVHGKGGVGCVSCHEGITPITRHKRVPHRIGIVPKCGECHQEVYRQYRKSLHAQVSQKLCYACHNPHYSISFRRMTGAQRKRICLKCHNATETHRWLPQKSIHFKYLECTSCHALNAQIGMILFIVDKDRSLGHNVLTFDQIASLGPVVKKALAKILDRNEKGAVSAAEIDAFMRVLRMSGIPGAGLDVRILVLRPTHDFTSKGEQARDCSLCHSEQAKFYSIVRLEVPEKDGGFRMLPADRQILARREQGRLMPDFYLLGESKIRKQDIEELATVVKRIGFKWLDLIGIFIVLVSVGCVLFHASLMFLTRGLRRRPERYEAKAPRPVPVNVWHWVHGLCVILLVLTGIQLRLPNVLPIFATFLNAVNLHNLSAAIVICDYLFWISYRLVRRQATDSFLMSPRDFLKDIGVMLNYYGHLIFIGERYPRTSLGDTTFDPVERLFFFTIMFIFVPLQILTGILLYDINTTMPVMRALGGLRLVDAVHLVCAYLIVASMIVHVYFHMLKKYR